ncbi:helix-turn-helix domain-containing protein [Spirosoma sp. HMF4905]|uniref:Helix-turn-helix domain-containing protein n=1 Tax=Spirosoma arboris TaxID=2682092 RepID=A0A7K1SKT0_9BACT|nr:helix-turn-helix transcriptional regulator [Spirosoma arboris]MVM34385.1 helix-turn-helix domain-containing protein [Spirosoma arboris]
MAITTLAEKIKAARKSKNLTQTELGERLGVTKGTIASYEAGRNNFTVETLQKISNALGVTISIDINPE